MRPSNAGGLPASPGPYQRLLPGLCLGFTVQTLKFIALRFTRFANYESQLMNPQLAALNLERERERERESVVVICLIF